MNNFTFYSPTYFVFGKDEENNVGKYVKRFGGTKVLIHYGGGSVVRSGLLDRVKQSLTAEGLSFIELGGVKPNPRSGLVYEGIELCRKEKGTVFAGVAIATALMPPLCTAGFGLASGNLTYFMGALYLFVINCLFIMLATYISVKYFKFRQVEYEDQSVGRRTKRISSIVILLFIVPSIWSAVILIRHNNFEENALAFVEHSKAYGRSIIYDYKIDHSDGSKIELFFTGEPLGDKTRESIYRTADEYGIEQKQILINDHTTTEKEDNLELIKGIYDKMDKETAWRDEEIRRLQDELKTAKGSDFPYIQLTREIHNSHPEVLEVQLSEGARVSADSLKLIPSVSVIITCSEALEEAEAIKLNEWLKIRLQRDDVTLVQKPQESLLPAEQH